MQTAENILQAMRKMGEKRIPLERVYRNLFSEDLFLAAYGKISRNKGALTAGSDEPLRLAQSCYFFLGWNERLCGLVDAILTAWKGDRHGFRFLLAMASFAHAEHGDVAYAETLGREALVNEPACPLGVHAVAHALAESGHPSRGAQWMREQHAHWAGESRMRTHNAWHLAMFDLEEGNVSSALGILDAWLMPAAETSPLDACDAVALLWRLSTEGVDDRGRWCRVSDAFERALTPGFWAYVDLHAALAHLTAGKRGRTQRLVEIIERCAQGRDHAALRARHITLPGLRALAAWVDHRYGEAAGRAPRPGTAS